MIDFHRLITKWYRLNARQLPWRDTENPYFIWLSEIILQQTRVDQGMNYYYKFIKAYPTVEDLAEAEEQDVLNNWQGLGYYSRARNLHASAKMIMNDFGGVFPETYTQVIKLKGVGEYSAAAISSFAYNEPYAVLDGNVFRVLSRVFDVDLAIDSTEGKKYFKNLAQELLPVSNSAEYNQAIMEFGAMQCTPKIPNCTDCILQNKCLAFVSKTIAERPFKAKKAKVKNRFFNYLIFKNDGFVYIKKRLDKDIWQHLFEFPMIETSEELSFSELNGLLRNKYNVQSYKSIKGKKHVLSHQYIFAEFYFINEIADFSDEQFIKIKIENLQDFPLPRLIDRFLESHDLL
jgi:A/G-specific adenine glycosylase